MKAPYWYVVKIGKGYYKPGGLARSQRGAEVTVIRHHARMLAAMRDGRVVRVWARLPKPRLPQWVDPTPLDAGEIEVWQRGETCWRRYVFRVDNDRAPAVAATFGDVGMWLTCVDVYRPGIDGSIEYRGEDTAPPDVWIEAGLRAAAMLRKAKK